MRPRILLVTDFYYPAKGREYFKEDLDLSFYLRQKFQLTISHIEDINPNDINADALLIRNTGPKSLHQNALNALIQNCKVPLSNDLKGKGDVLGKNHLIELFHLGYPVIPSVDSIRNLAFLGKTKKYLIKPKNGCDSTGVQVLPGNELKNLDLGNSLIQPCVEFDYEVSFYFIDDQYQYALYAPEKEKRWNLELFSPTQMDLQFAQSFIQWNTCRRGIQRVDACRLPSGELLLMELEDYNPYLSLHLLPRNLKESFVSALCSSLKEQMNL